jgi:chromosome segregation ATPase
MTNEVVTKEIVKCIGMTSPGPHAVILVTSIGRFTQEEQDTVNHFVNHFGEGCKAYMIVLFTRKDDLDDDDQSLDKYVSSSPPQLRDLVRQCNDRCIGFNNRGSKSEKENQIKQLFKMIDTMVLNNGGTFYTNEMFEEAEKTLKRRMIEIKNDLNRKKRKEIEEMEKNVQQKYKGTLENAKKQNATVKAQLERERREKKQKEAEINEIQQQLRQMKTAQNRSKYRSYQYGDTFNSQRTTKQDIYSLQRDQDRYIEEQRKKQVELEELTKQQEERNRQEQRKMERFYNEQSNEVERRRREMDDRYERLQRTENLRRQARNDVQNEEPGLFRSLWNGVKSVGRYFKSLFFG